MKRLAFVARFADRAHDAELRAWARQGWPPALDVGGAAVLVGDTVVMVLEGADQAVDGAYASALGDRRLADVACLGVSAVVERHYRGWSALIEPRDGLAHEGIVALADALREARRALSAYVHPGVMQAMCRGRDAVSLPVRRVQSTVLFADIAGFSTLAERVGDDETVMLVNHFFDTCAGLIERRGGVVAKFIGDAVMAHFPGEGSDQPLATALEILRECRSWREVALEGSPLAALHVGVGLASGQVLEGTFGSATRRDYTIVGDAVNAAARLESLTRKCDKRLLFSEEVRAASTLPLTWVHLGPQPVRGKFQPVETCSLVHPLVDDPFPTSPNRSGAHSVLPGGQSTRFLFRGDAS